MMIFFMTLALSWPSFIGVSASLSKDVSIASSLLRGKQQDPFVQLAPLVVAMACRDGVALVAAHPWSEDDDFLLFGETDEDASNSLEGVSRNPNSNTANSALTGLPFLDLPTTYAGPLRIQSVGSQGTALVACGWRADGSGRLLEKARSLCDKELGAFGDEFIRFLPIQLSLYMADCAVSERMRSLSCAAMMAYSRHSSIKSKHSDIGGLCLIDETGAYPVRAHCLGGGFMTIRSKSSDENVLVADFINGKLLELWNRQESLDLPYFDISARESLSIIINLLSSTTSMDSNDSPTVLRRKARLELAIVDVSRKRLIRKRVRDISSL